MASSYNVVGSSSTIRVLGPTQAIDVEAITIITKPSGVRLVIQVPSEDFKNDTYTTYLVVSADLVESVLGQGEADGSYLATAAYQSQDTDASGLIAYYISFLVSYQPAGITALPLTQWVTFPMTTFETAEAFQTAPGPYALLTATYARLQKLAGS